MNLRPAVELFEKPGLGRVDKAIAPNHRGRVFFEGTYWPARLYSADAPLMAIAEVESAVSVLGRQGLTLLVRPFVTNPVG
ncbi:MAG: NfeD family protein [Pseudanabaenales cyanobacterium]|nr:NfeD family protein [Pseudanabaenales cyanobacterium]